RGQSDAHSAVPRAVAEERWRCWRGARARFHYRALRCWGYRAPGPTTSQSSMLVGGPRRSWEASAPDARGCPGRGRACEAGAVELVTVTPIGPVHHVGGETPPSPCLA